MPRKKYNPFIGKFTRYVTKDSTQTQEGREIVKFDTEYSRFSLIAALPAGVYPDDADLREVAIIGDGLWIYDNRGMPGDPQWYPIVGGVGGYTHPLTHPSTMITEDSPTRIWFTLDERNKLASMDIDANNYILPTASSSTLGGIKIGDHLTIELDGTLNADLQSDQNFTSSLKSKLDSISYNANNYILPTASSSTLGGVKIGNRLNIELDGTLNANLQSDQNFTSILKNKLDSIDYNANNYVHPVTHSPSIILQNSSNRFVTDTQISEWDNKIDSPLTNTTHGNLSGGSLHTVATILNSGFMSTTDKQKLDSVEWGSNNYVHPSTHHPSIIEQNPAYRFVNDTQISNWNNKLDSPFTDISHGDRGGGSLHALATTSTPGFLSPSDKVKLNAIDVSGVLPHTHVASTDIITVSPNYLWFTQSERDKLAGIENNANKYVHPSTHLASIITQSSLYRFVTDVQISEWDNKIDSPLTNTTHGNLSGGSLHSLVSVSVAGFMSPADKVKLDGIENNANNYIHPLTHPATLITEISPNYLWFTQSERDKLIGIESNANNYIHPLTHDATIIVEDINHRFVTDVQISEWDNKIDSPLTNTTHGNLSGGSLHSLASSSIAGFMSASDKLKLNGIESNANNYIHPLTHDATMINEISPDYLWFTQDERDKLLSIESNANNYIHPLTHDATIIVEDINHRFVTDVQISEWDNKIDSPLTNTTHGNLSGGNLHTEVTSSSSGFMSTSDKIKLDGIENNANNYIHPSTHPATIIIEDSEHNFVTDVQISDWDNKLNSPITDSDHGNLSGGTLHEIATISVSGFMSFDDKIKLNGIEDNANNYVHPLTHPANMIVEDSNHRFITDTEKSKLLSIEWSANNYTHPLTHPATMITTDVDHRFVTDIQIDYWNAKCETPLTDIDHGTLSGGTLHSLATNVNAGFMSAIDKAKLDLLPPSPFNTFSTIRVEATDIEADQTDDIIEFIAGDNIILTPNPTNDSITISIDPVDLNADTLDGLDSAFYTNISHMVSGILNPDLFSDYSHGDRGGGSLHTIVSDIEAGFMSPADKIKLDTAVAYVHPTGDGNLHVPATGTTNSGKVLMAGSTAGDISWQDVSTSIQESVGTVKEFTSSTSLIIGDIVKASLLIDNDVEVLTDNRDVDPAIGVVAETSPGVYKVISYGDLIGVSFLGLERGKKVFLGTDGKPTTTPPTTGYLQEIGFCYQDNNFFVNVQYRRVKLNPF